MWTLICAAVTLPYMWRRLHTLYVPPSHISGASLPYGYLRRFDPLPAARAPILGAGFARSPAGPGQRLAVRIAFAPRLVQWLVTS